VSTKPNKMKNIINRVQLIGNLGANPEVKDLDNGNAVAKLSIATTESYKNKQGEKITDTQWHNLVAWGNTAKFAEKYLTKGSKIAIDGKLVNRNYTDKEGNKRYVTEVVVNEFMMLGSKN
jgi:single-strand DNA-binding protein